MILSCASCPVNTKHYHILSEALSRVRTEGPGFDQPVLVLPNFLLKFQYPACCFVFVFFCLRVPVSFVHVLPSVPSRVLI